MNQGDIADSIFCVGMAMAKDFLTLDQIAIAFTGATAIFLSQDRSEHVRKWACILGLIGQPFWFYATWQAGQWGIFVLCFLYTISWARGFWNNWMRP